MSKILVSTLAIIKALQQRPRNTQELATIAGCDRLTVENRINMMYDQGMVYVHHKALVGKSGRHSRFWAWNPVPFQHKDNETAPKIDKKYVLHGFETYAEARTCFFQFEGEKNFRALEITKDGETHIFRQISETTLPYLKGLNITRYEDHHKSGLVSGLRAQVLGLVR